MGKHKEDTGWENEYPTYVHHLDLFREEALDNIIYSLILLDRNYSTFNDKFQQAMSERKTRICEIVGRIKTLGQKINCLQNFNKRMAISAAKNYPFKRGFVKDTSLHHDEHFNPKPEELDPHYHKIYGRRLIHEPAELSQRIKTSMKDLSELMNLYKKFTIERDIVGEIARKKPIKGEGYLGKTPENVSWVSEIMLFDAPVNVYSDSHVVLDDLQVAKPISKKEIAWRKKEQERLERQKRIWDAMKQDEDNRKGIYQAPESLQNREKNEQKRRDEFKFFPKSKEQPKIEFKAGMSLGNGAPQLEDDDFMGDNPMVNMSLTGEAQNATSTVSMMVGGQETIAPSKHKEIEKEYEKELLSYNEAANLPDSLSNRQKETDEKGSRFRPIPM